MSIKLAPPLTIATMKTTPEFVFNLLLICYAYPDFLNDKTLFDGLNGPETLKKMQIKVLSFLFQFKF